MCTHALIALVSYRRLSDSYSSEIVMLDDTKTGLIPRTTVIQKLRVTEVASATNVNV